MFAYNSSKDEYNEISDYDFDDSEESGQQCYKRPKIITPLNRTPR